MRSAALLACIFALGCGGSDSEQGGEIVPAIGGSSQQGFFGGSGRIAPGASGQSDSAESAERRSAGGAIESEPIDPTLDTDKDQIFDINDNCPSLANPGQEDFDDDGLGNECDTDLDGDGTPNLEDCAPFEPSIFNGAPELCNGVDDNCNGVTDEDPDDSCVTFYPDADGDGSGAQGQGVCMCDATPNFPTPFGGDCNDSNAQISAFAVETCDNVDNNCNDLVDEGCDDDGDGYCDFELLVVGNPDVCVNGGGDCIDFSAAIYPGAPEIAGDGFDNNCDGIAEGEASSEFKVTCPDNCLSIGDAVESYLCALGMCFPEYIQSAQFASPTGDDISSAYAVVNHFGSLNNDLAPFEGSSYGLLASGPATGTSHTTDLSGGSSIPDPFSTDGYNTNDNVEFIVQMVAPPGSLGFSIDYVFFSTEYEEWIGSSFNDKFYIILDAPITTGGSKTVINTTACSNPNSYYDIIDPQGNKQCFIAINTAFSEPCPNVPTDISGTGYECGAGSSSDGSSTGWLTTSWPIQPNEAFTLTFHIHDTSDGILDSEVILDNFRFETVPSEFSQGTTNAN